MRQFITVRTAGMFLFGGWIVGDRHLPTLGTRRVAEKMVASSTPCFEYAKKGRFEKSENSETSFLRCLFYPSFNPLNFKNSCELSGWPALQHRAFVDDKDPSARR